MSAARTAFAFCMGLSVLTVAAPALAGEGRNGGHGHHARSGHRSVHVQGHVAARSHAQVQSHVQSHARGYVQGHGRTSYFIPVQAQSPDPTDGYGRAWGRIVVHGSGGQAHLQSIYPQEAHIASAHAGPPPAEAVQSGGAYAYGHGSIEVVEPAAVAPSASGVRIAAVRVSETHISESRVVAATGGPYAGSVHASAAYGSQAAAPYRHYDFFRDAAGRVDRSRDERAQEDRGGRYGYSERRERRRDRRDCGC